MTEDARAARIVRRGDREYPHLLGATKEPPVLLHARGRRLDALGPFVAVVGARRPTSYGREVARDLARGLAARGVCVVSGMARGIDAEAHRGALEAGGPTVAVLAAGVQRPYPASHARLFEEILARGAVISELPGGPSHAYLFPIRNRIIAGMSYGVVVVQATFQSGTRSTVDHALAAGREVFAVPGDVRSDLSGFPHWLVREGARLVTGVQDLHDDLKEMPGWTEPRASSEPPPNLDPEEAAALSAVSAEPGSMEVVVARSGLAPGAAARALGRLELSALVVRGDDGAYRRRRA